MSEKEKTKKEDKKESWVPEQQAESPTPQATPKGENDPWALIKNLDKMIEILKEANKLQKEGNEIQKEKITAIKEATEATNALITTLVGQVRNPSKPVGETIPLPQPPVQPIIGSQGDKPLVNPSLLKSFPADLQDNLEVVEEGDNWRVNITTFLGGNNFGRVSAVALELHGKYVSAGKNSHFLIPKTVKESSTPKEQAKLPEVKTTPTSTTESKQMSNIKMLFPEDLEIMLYFTDEEDYIVVKPRQFLGSDNFAKVASIIREIGGDYISAGKDSHFRVSKK